MIPTNKLTVCLPLVVAMTALLASPAAAQRTKVLPSSAASTGGNSGTPFPFGFGSGRVQQIWLGSAVTKSVAVINGFSYRLDENLRSPLAKRDLNNVTIKIGPTTVAPSKMANAFSANLTGTMTTVLNNKTFSAPAQPIPSNPAKFNINVNLARPFIFVPAKNDNLVIEWTVPGQSSKANYILDAIATTTLGGSVNPFGNPGQFSGPELWSFSAKRNTLRQGGTLDITAGSFRKRYNAGLILGLSNKKWNGINLPLSLAPNGAPKNSLYVSMDVLLPYAPTLSLVGFWKHNVMIPIPVNSRLSGLTFYAQSHFGDSAANAMGLVTSQGLALTLPTGTGPGTGPITAAVGHYDSTKSAGSANQPGAVVQFKGVLP